MHTDKAPYWFTYPHTNHVFQRLQVELKLPPH